jgi:hypothetical protein
VKPPLILHQFKESDNRFRWGLPCCLLADYGLKDVLYVGSFAAALVSSCQLKVRAGITEVLYSFSLDMWSKHTNPSSLDQIQISHSHGCTATGKDALYPYGNACPISFYCFNLRPQKVERVTASRGIRDWIIPLPAFLPELVVG